MHTTSGTWKSDTTSLAHRVPRAVARHLSLGALAAALITTAALPAFAGKPDHRQHGGHHAQEQEHEASASGKRRGNKKSVKKSFSSGGAIVIPAKGAVDDFGPADAYPSTIAVSGFKKAKITDLNLTLRDFSHEFAPDVDVLLVAPDGRNVVAMGDVGDPADFSGVTNLTITLDDEATAALPVAEDEVTSGSFQPLDNFGLVDNENPSSGQLNDFPAPAPTPSGTSALSTFDGIDPNGEWQLFVLDDNSSDVGSLASGWTLDISAKSKAKNKSNGKKKR